MRSLVETPAARALPRPALLAALALPLFVAACVTGPGRPITGGPDSARYACSQEAQSRGYFVVNMGNVERRSSERYRVDMIVARDGRQFEARCDYDHRDRYADLDVRR